LDKTIIGLLGGASALALIAGAQVFAAAPPDEATLRPARSFAELLDPIPNATSVLRAEDERVSADASVDERPLVMGQYHHHHHHHHHYRHHHHHHHYHHHHHWHGNYY
jgi:hypothetical protein